MAFQGISNGKATAGTGTCGAQRRPGRCSESAHLGDSVSIMNIW